MSAQESSVAPGPPSEEDVTTPSHPQPFNPFFTVIENSTTGEHHHPHVHYLFQDDADSQDHSHGPEYLTYALLHHLDPHGSAKQLSSSQHSDAGDGQPSDEANPTQSVPANERFIIVDLGPDGRSVSSAKSLSPDWQISGTSVIEAPTFAEKPGVGPGDGREEDASGRQDDTALMLKIRGAESAAGEERGNVQNTLEGAKKQGGDGVEGLFHAMEALKSRYEREMELLAKWKEEPARD